MVNPFFEKVSSFGFIPLYPGVVPGSHEISPQLLSSLKQGIKLNILVAPDTRIWCPPQAILSTKIGDNLLGKDVSEIHHVVWNAKLIGYPSGIIYGAEPATATKPISFIGLLIRGPDLHGDTNHLMALLLKNGGGN